MPSLAFTIHLIPLLRDAEELEDAHAALRTGAPGRQYGLASVNRAAVVMAISAWEAFVEELVRESLEALRPGGPAMGVWPAWNASVRGELGRFNNPNPENVRTLFSNALGLLDIRQGWTWFNCTWEQAVARLAQAIQLRHQIAHGVNPRPVIHNHFSSRLPEFFRRLAQCTDTTVRQFLVQTHGVQTPWTS